MQGCTPDLQLYSHMAEILKPYMARRPLTTDIPSRAWQEWFDGIVRAAHKVTARRRAVRWNSRTLNSNNAVRWEPPNWNDREPDPLGSGHGYWEDHSDELAGLALPTTKWSGHGGQVRASRVPERERGATDDVDEVAMMKSCALPVRARESQVLLRHDTPSHP